MSERKNNSPLSPAEEQLYADVGRLQVLTEDDPRAHQCITKLTQEAVDKDDPEAISLLRTIINALSGFFR